MKIRMMLAGVLCAVLLSGCAVGPSLTVPEELSPAVVSTLCPEPTPEPSLDTDELDVLALRAEEGEILPASLLLAPVELSEVLEGNLIGYARLRTDGWVFEWLESNYRKPDETLDPQEEKLVISGGSAAQGYQVFEYWECAFGDVGADHKLIYRDVDFDGRPDLLLCMGHFGNQGALAYTCFLQRGNGFEECASFSDIANPIIDEENQLILGSGRSNAATHYWTQYAYEDGTFRCVKRLTEGPGVSQDMENIVCQYVEETWIDGEWVTEVWSCDEHTKEETQARYYEAGGLWELGTGRWMDWI